MTRSNTFYSAVDCIFSSTGCTNDKTIVTMTETVGTTVTLKCPRTTGELLFWIRAVPGTLPELLGQLSNQEHDGPHFKTRPETRSFVLVIKKASETDTGLYLCTKKGKTWSFLMRVDLTIAGKCPVGLVFK